MSHRGQKSSSLSLSRSSRRQNLRWRLLALLGAVLLITLLIIGAGVSYFVFLTEQEAWQGRQGEAARNAVETVEAFIQDLEDSLTMVSLLDRDYLTAEPQVMRDLLQQNPALLEMVRLDASGKVFASAYQDTPLLANLFTIPQSTWFLQAAAGELYLGNIQISPAGDPYLVIAVPAPDGGVVAARLCMNMLWDMVAAIRFGETGHAYIVNQESRIVAHTKPEVVLAKTSLAGRAEVAALSQSPGHKWNGVYVNFEGIPVVGTMVLVPGTSWVVITELTQSEAFAVSRTAGLLLGGGMLLLGVLVLWVTTPLLERQIFEPMEKLRAGAERIGRGDLSHRIDIARQDEVGQVAAAFNEMVVRLREREDQLTTRTAALAAEVAERMRAEEAVRQERDRVQKYLDIAGVIIVAIGVKEEVSLINQEGCEILGYEQEEILGKNWFDNFLPETIRDEARVVFQKLVAGEVEPVEHFENPVLTKSDEERIVAWHNTILRNEAGSIIGTLSSGEDITERKRAEAKRAYRLQMERALSQASSRFVNPQNLDQAINEMLRDTGTVLNASRAYLFKIHDDGAKMDNTHEWVAEGTTPQIENLQGLDTDIFPWWMNKLYDNEIIAASDVSQLPSPEKKILEEQDILSILAIPIFTHGTLYGFFGFDETERHREWESEEIGFLKSAARILGRALERAQAEESLHRRARQLATLNAIGHRAAAILDEQELLQTIVDNVARELDYFRVAILLMAGDTPDELYVAAANDDFWTVIPDNYRQRVGEGLIGAAAATGETQLANQALSDPRFYRAGEWGSPSSLSVPIKAGGEVIGVLEVEEQIPDAFDQQDVDVLETVAGQLSVAIANARLYEETQRRATEFSVLYSVATAGTTSLHLDEILQHSLDALHEALRPDDIAILLVEPETGELVIRAWTGFPEGPKLMRRQIGVGTPGWVVQTGEPVLSADVRQDDRYHACDADTRSEMCVPLRVSERIIGALNLESRRQGDFSEEDLRLASTLAGNLAMLIERARLFDEVEAARSKLQQRAETLEQRAAQLALLNDIGGKIAAVLDLDSVLDGAARLVQGRFGYHHVALLTLDRERDELVMRARAGPHAHPFPPGHRLKLGQGMVGWVGRHGETLLANNVDTEPRYINLYPDTIPIRSELSVPIRIGEEIMGVLDIQSPQFNTFGDGDVMVMETLAGQIAVAIENARLYEAVRQELTERKRAEEQLERYAAELEQRNKEVKQFAYIVSHDLRASLINLKGFSAELRSALEVVGPALDTALPHLDDGQRQAVTVALEEDIPEALGFIDSSVTRMDHFINAVLRLSRLGRRELKPGPIDMNALVQATLQTLAHQIEERQVSVTVGSLPEVSADRTSMEQIMGNLLTNAVLYLDPGRPGEIEVGAGERNQVIKKEPGFTTFWVRDNGRGIAEEDMDKVFAPFRRAGRQDVPGEGMGLAYVQTLVRRHGGRIGVKSEPGKGSTFYFTIPVDVKRETSNVNFLLA